METKANITTFTTVFATFWFLLLSSFVYSQSVQSTGSVVSSGNVAVASAAQSNSQMELVMWLMGSNVQKHDNITNTISTNGTEKKKYINVGLTPNRILIKTIFKKAASRSSMIG